MGKLPVLAQAICCVWRNSKEGVVPTGVIGPDGEKFYAFKTEKLSPGTRFSIDDPDEVRRLLEAEAIEVLEDGWEDVIAAAAEVAYIERNGSPAPKTKHWPRPTYQNEVPASDVDGLV